MALPVPSYSLTQSVLPRTQRVEFIGGGEVVVRRGQPRVRLAVQWRGRTGDEARMIMDELLKSAGVDEIDGWETPEPVKYRTQGGFSMTRTTGDFADVVATLEATAEL